MVSESEVFEVLSSLNPNKAMGIDGIGPRVLKNCALAIYQPLQHLFQTSISQHKVPAEWKIHCITPIHKSGDRSSVTNYRPISLLCSISKVLERIIYNKLVELLETALAHSQFGFLKGRSALQQLLVFYNNIFESKCQTDVIYLDFAKAFDSVPHNSSC